MSANIRKMTLDDFYKISDILISDFDDFWSCDCLKQELNCKASYFLVASIDEEIIGFAGFKKILDEADIMNIVVSKKFRGQGIGSLLLEALISDAKSLGVGSITLEVNVKNSVAISLYHKFGFVDIGVRTKYYNGVDDGIIMRKET